MRVIRPENQGTEEKVFSGERGFFKGIHSFARTVGKGIRSRVGEACGWKSPREGKQGPHTGFQEMNPLNSKATGWKTGLGDTSQNDNGNLGPILAKNITHEDIGPKIDVNRFKETSGIVKPEIVTPYQVMYYNSEGKGYQTVPKGTHIEYNGKTIYSLYNEKTKKHETYARVKTFTKAIGTTGRDFESVPEGYIRTPWFDGMANKTDKETTNVSHEKKQKAVNFGGFYGSNGEIIEGYIVKKVIKNYLKRKIPELENTIEEIKQDIFDSGKKIANEAFIKGVSLKQTIGYESHVGKLQKKKAYERASQEIRSFTMNDQEIIEPTVASIIKSIQNKPIWRKIIEQSTYVSKKHKEKQRLARMK